LGQHREFGEVREIVRSTTHIENHKTIEEENGIWRGKSGHEVQAGILLENSASYYEKTPKVRWIEILKGKNVKYSSRL